jgi:hypothetical protein
MLVLILVVGSTANALGRKIDARGVKYTGVHHSRSMLVQGKEWQRNQYEKKHAGNEVIRERGRQPYVR